MKNNSRSSMCRYNNNIVILYVNYDALFACVVLNTSCTWCALSMPQSCAVEIFHHL